MEVACQDVKAQLDVGANFLLLDCREQNEYNLVRINGSTLLPMSEIQDRLSELEPHRESKVVVYCHHGMRSLQVTNWLRLSGFTDVWSMQGGINQWAEIVDPSMPRY